MGSAVLVCSLFNLVEALTALMKEVYLGTNFYICLIEVPRDLCSQMFCVLGLDLFSPIDNTAVEHSKISRLAGILDIFV